MLTHVATMACLRVIKDELSGFLTIQDLISQGYYVSGDPPNFGPFMLLTKWANTPHPSGPAEFSIKLELLDSNKKKIKAIGEVVDFTIPENQFTDHFGMSIPIVETNDQGLYFFKLSYKEKSEASKWKTATTLPMMLIAQKPHEEEEEEE